MATAAALETLAVIAYKQPVTRSDVEELRGVDVSGVLANLIEKGFVRIVGKKEIPGRPFLYATTEKFLEHFDKIKAGLRKHKTLDGYSVVAAARRAALFVNQLLISVA